MKNFFLRLVSSIVLLPIFLYSIYYKGLLLICMLILILCLFLYEIKFLIKNLFLFIFLLILMIFFIFALYQIRGNDLFGFYNLLWIMTIVWFSDIGGYIVGKLVQGPKFCKWSPNKTISGLLGSFCFSQQAFFVLYFTNLSSSFSLNLFFIQLVLCFFSIFGDLFFSYLKRLYSIKDYSSAIPGHGGLLDRIDGLIFVISVGYIMKVINAY